MIAEKFIRISKGLIKAMIPIRSIHNPSPTGGTSNSRYCYTTWLRHLILLNRYQKGIPGAVAELGPGDSLGTGIAALISGCEKYVGLDIFTYWDAAQNVKIFDELVILFKNKTTVPDASEFPRVRPYLDNYDFPAHILTEEILAVSMAAERLAAIRKELASPAASNIFVKYFVPWQADDIKKESIDFVFSQGALQFAEMDFIYHTMNTWLKPNGMMAHVIDFSSLGMSKVWNGHWAYSSLEWKLFSIGKKMLINRAAVSVHKEYLVKYNFSLLDIITYKKEQGFQQNQLAKEFRNLSNDDLETQVAYMLSEKMN